MTSAITKYRQAHPEFRERERERDLLNKNIKYIVDPEFREKVKQRSSDRYKNDPVYREKVKQQANERNRRIREEKILNMSVKV